MFPKTAQQSIIGRVFCSTEKVNYTQKAQRIIPEQITKRGLKT